MKVCTSTKAVCTSVPPLSFIDDIIGITKCSVLSVKLNALIQSKMNNKKLQLSEKKCFKMHVYLQKVGPL